MKDDRDHRMDMMEKRRMDRRLELRRMVMERREEPAGPAMYYDMRMGIDRRQDDRRSMERRHGNA